MWWFHAFVAENSTTPSVVLSLLLHYKKYRAYEFQQTRILLNLLLFFYNFMQAGPKTTPLLPAAATSTSVSPLQFLWGSWKVLHYNSVLRSFHLYQNYNLLEPLILLAPASCLEAFMIKCFWTLLKRSWVPLVVLYSLWTKELLHKLQLHCSDILIKIYWNWKTWGFDINTTK